MALNLSKKYFHEETTSLRSRLQHTMGCDSGDVVANMNNQSRNGYVIGFPRAGIANRRHFDNTIDLEWWRAMRNAKPLSLIIIDVDYLKNYNDVHGHQAGDSCLQKIP